MFRGLLTTLFFLSWSTVSLGSLVLLDSKGFYTVGLYLDILEDKTGLLTINDISKPKFSSKFKKSTSEAPNFGGSKSYFWARLKINNRATKKKNVFENVGKQEFDNVNSSQKFIERFLHHVLISKLSVATLIFCLKI